MVILYYGKRTLFSGLIIFGYLSFTTFRGQKTGFNSYECIKFLKIANIHALDVWGKRLLICNIKISFLCFFMFIPFATQLFSTPYTSGIPNLFAISYHLGTPCCQCVPHLPEQLI